MSTALEAPQQYDWRRAAAEQRNCRHVAAELAGIAPEAARGRDFEMFLANQVLPRLRAAAAEEELANFAWIDTPGASYSLHELRQAVADFLEEADFRGEREIDAARRAEPD